MSIPHWLVDYQWACSHFHDGENDEKCYPNWPTYAGRDWWESYPLRPRSSWWECHEDGDLFHRRIDTRQAGRFRTRHQKTLDFARSRLLQHHGTFPLFLKTKTADGAVPLNQVARTIPTSQGCHDFFLGIVTGTYKKYQKHRSPPRKSRGVNISPSMDWLRENLHRKCGQTPPILEDFPQISPAKCRGCQSTDPRARTASAEALGPTAVKVSESLSWFFRAPQWCFWAFLRPKMGVS